MRIGFDYRLGGIKHGGLGRYSLELLKSLLRLNQTDTFVIFYNIDQDGSDLDVFSEYPNVELVRAPFRHYSVKEQLLFPRLIHRSKVDIMHFPNFNVPVFLKVPFVVTIHDVVHHKLSGHKKSRLVYFYGYKFVIEQAAKKALRIITISESSKKEIVEELQVSEDKVNVIYQGVNVFEPTLEEIGTVKSNFLLSRPYFLFVGVLERKKNIGSLTRGFDIFLNKYNLDMDLVIAGRADPHYPEIRDEALNIRHRSRVVFTGFVTDSELMALYAGAYAFVTASLFEGFGLPGVEAMKFALPILAANTEVFNEIYDNAALYFDGMSPEDIAEKMHLITRDARFTEQYRLNSLKRAELYNWEKAATETLSIYKSVLTGYA